MLRCGMWATIHRLIVCHRAGEIADLTGIDLFALIGADTPLRRVASTNGGE